MGGGPFSALKNCLSFDFFGKISALDSYFIHGNICIKYRSVRFRVKSTNYFGSYGPFSTLKNSFRLISFENISVLDSDLVPRYIIIK